MSTHLEPRKQRALFELVDLFLKSPNLDVSGRALRTRLRGVATTLDQQRAAAASLVPDLAKHSNPDSADDRFRPTLRGLLAGYPPAAEIIGMTLRFLHEKAEREPEFVSYDPGELRRFFEGTLGDPADADDFPDLAVRHVLDVAGLASAWFGTHWGVPKDLEDLFQLRSAADLVQYWEKGSIAATDAKLSTPDASQLRADARGYDVFISHASEDKREVARPLYEGLTQNGLRVWFDEAELRLGDRLRKKIDEGLTICRYGVVILSPNFFKKEWPQLELDGLFARETTTGEKAILPIWHNLDTDAVARYSPMLAGRLAARSADGIDALVSAILHAIVR